MIDPGPGRVHSTIEAHFQRLAVYRHLGGTFLQRNHLRVVDDHGTCLGRTGYGRQNQAAVVRLRIFVDRRRTHPAQLDRRNQLARPRRPDNLHLRLAET